MYLCTSRNELGGSEVRENRRAVCARFFAIMLVFAVCAFCGCRRSESDNPLPLPGTASLVADFTATPVNGVAKLFVTFTDQSKGDITSWSWDFGDGIGTSALHDPTYTYNNPGTYTVSLVVSGPYGSATETKLNYITVGDTIYVDDASGDDLNDGSLGSPVKTIQRGLNLAVSGNTVLVADGTYTGASNRDLDFGGKTINLRSEGGAANCTIDCQFLGRAFHFHTGETNTATVRGFTIQSGEPVAGEKVGAILCENSSSPTITGCEILNNKSSGIYCDNSSPTLKNCKIGNNSGGRGGGIGCRNQSCPTIENCLISENQAINFTMDAPGGGIAILAESDPVLTNCTIVDNWAYYGGGIYCHESAPTLTNCIIHNNSGIIAGGGIYCDMHCLSTITGCEILNNQAGYGGGIYCRQSSPTLKNCKIGNNSGVDGGGIYCYNQSSPNIENCLISGNQVYYPGPGGPASGGGIAILAESDPVLTNCTIVDNSADYGGGIYCHDLSDPTAVNCIIWANSALVYGNQIYMGDMPSCTLTLNCCAYSDYGVLDVVGPGVNPEPNCINDDPLFVTGPDGDYYLSQAAAGQGSDSPCLDAGSDTAANLGLDTKTTRTDGVTDTGTVDIGYHYDP